MTSGLFASGIAAQPVTKPRSARSFAGGGEGLAVGGMIEGVAEAMESGCDESGRTEDNGVALGLQPMRRQSSATNHTRDTLVKAATLATDSLRPTRAFPLRVPPGPPFPNALAGPA